MPRPATGSPRWNPSASSWEARISLPGKPGRSAVPMPGIPKADKARALELAKLISDRMRSGEAVSVGAGETVNEFSVRWLNERDARGLRAVHDDRSRMRNWILPSLGTLPIASVKRSHVEDLRDALDGHVVAGKLAWKTATMIWGLVTKMFSDARNAKLRALRVRDDNPTADVIPPDRGSQRAKVYLYPAEFLALVSCEHVPLQWRRFFAVTTYLYARAGEVKALSFSKNIDLERGIAHIHESIDGTSGELKETKTGLTRRLPIEPNLLPLLHAMKREGIDTLFEWAATDRGRFSAV